MINLALSYYIYASVEVKLDPVSIEGVKLTQAYLFGEKVRLSNPDFLGEYIVVTSYIEAYPEKTVACFTLKLVGM